MLLLKNGAKFYALTWKDLQDILFMGEKKLQNVGERLTSFVSLSTHTYTDTQTCARTDVRTHTHTHPLTHTSHYAHFKDEETEGLPWWFNGEDSLLLMQGARVRSLVRELDPVW